MQKQFLPEVKTYVGSEKNKQKAGDHVVDSPEALNEVDLTADGDEGDEGGSMPDPETLSLRNDD